MVGEKEEEEVVEGSRLTLSIQSVLSPGLTGEIARVAFSTMENVGDNRAGHFGIG